MVNRLRLAGWLQAAVAALSFACVMAGAAAWMSMPATAADHLDPPSRTNVGANSDVAADIADVYFFHFGGNVVLALTGAGPKAAGLPGVYDRDVLTRFHISNDGTPGTDEFVIEARFGRDPLGNWGVQFTGIPGSSGPMVGPVQTTITDGPVRATAGVFDDPFFFDSEGFSETRATGKLSIRNDRNFFAGKNDTSLVMEFPRAAVTFGSFPLTVWAETRRISGP